MPKLKKKFADTKTAPPIDWLHAAILERKVVYGIDLKEMADIAGVDYGTMRHLINKSPWLWKWETRERVCKRFGIELTYTPSNDGKVEVKVG